MSSVIKTNLLLNDFLLPLIKSITNVFKYLNKGCSVKFKLLIRIFKKKTYIVTFLCVYDGYSARSI